ncbi:hypothetical protein RAS2_25290 [Phycisphaerae bacterium RAS2]|nr:hypothetical protein RAS2_25290 [Phycisphaerae bacterium RAS2]
MAGPIARFIDHAVLLVLLTLIPLRAVAGETHTFETPRLLRGLASFGPSPTTTFAIAAIIVACAGWVFASGAWRGRRLRTTGLEAGGLMLLVASIIAFARAGQKHLALIGAADFLTIVLYAITLRQLLTSRWHLRLGLAVVMATAGMLVAKACYQKWVEWPATIKYYEEHRAELLGTATPANDARSPGALPATQRATALSDDASEQRREGLIHDYEARLRSGAMTGYFAHPNILGSCMAMLTLCCGGIAFTRWRSGRRGAMVAPTLLAFSCAGVLIGSQSKGAGAACIASALFFLPGMVRSIRPDLISPRITKPLSRTFARRMVIAGWILAAVGASSLFAMLRAEPGLLGLSMRYRAMYWEGAKAMVDDVGVWGIGPDNFGRHFTRYKPVACPEEVDDPHNWLIKSFVEYGWLGAAGLLALLIGGSLKLATVPSPSQEEGWGEGDPRAARTQSVVLNLAVVLALFALAWCILIAGAPSDFTIVMLALGLAPFALFFVAGAIERADTTSFDESDMPLLAAGLGAGLVAFLAHAFIDLALFTPGAATMFFAVAAIALAAREPRQFNLRGHNHEVRVLFRQIVKSLAVAAATTALVAIMGLRTTAMYFYGEHTPSISRTPGNSGSHDFGFWKTIDLNPLDGTAVEERLDLLSANIASTADTDYVLKLANVLKRRDPFNAAVWHHRMAAYSARFAMTGDVADLRQAVAMQQKSVEAYPTSPLRWLALGDLLERLAEQTRDPADRRAAAEALQRAVDLDGQRIYVSKPNRLSAELVQAIRARVERLR